MRAWLSCLWHKLEPRLPRRWRKYVLVAEEWHSNDGSPMSKPLARLANLLWDMLTEALQEEHLKIWFVSPNENRVFYRWNARDLVYAEKGSCPSPAIEEIAFDLRKIAVTMQCTAAEVLISLSMLSEKAGVSHVIVENFRAAIDCRKVEVGNGLPPMVLVGKGFQVALIKETVYRYGKVAETRYCTRVTARIGEQV